MELEQEQLKYQTSNESFIEPNVLQLRLDTRELLDRIKSFLAGGRIAYSQDENGFPIANFIREGNPLCNDFGVQSITSWISMQINPSTVQGNIDRHQYLEFLYRTRRRLAKNILINSPRYEIQRSDRPLIMDGIMNMIELFVSRTLDNKERDSYSTSLGARVGNFLNNQKKTLF